MPKKIDHNERRRDFAEAAVRVIGELGIDNTRLVDVAREANATTGSITHYFEDKDALLLAAFDRVAQRLLQQIDQAGIEDLVGLASSALPLDDEDRRDWRVWLCFLSRAISDPKLAHIHKTYYEEFRDGVAGIIRRHQATGHLSAKINPPVIADMIIAAVDGIGVRATLEPEDWPAKRQRLHLETMLHPLLPTT